MTINLPKIFFKVEELLTQSLVDATAGRTVEKGKVA